MDIKPVIEYNGGKKSSYRAVPKFTNHPQVAALQSIIRKLNSGDNLTQADKELLKQNQIFIGLRNNQELSQKINDKIAELNAPPRNRFDNPRQKALHEAREALGLL